MPADYRYTLDAITRSREPHVQVASEDTLGIQHALFGYQIPYLPDYLADHTLLGSTRSERVTEVLSRWAQFILGLRKWRASAFALRFLAHPTEGEIEVVLLGRLRGKGQQIPHAALEMATDLAVQLTALGLPHEPLPEVLLQRMLSPFDMVPTILEVRQHEETTSFLTVKDEAYVVHPFWAPAGTWLLPFETMLRQPVPVAVSVFLEPTQLTSPERENLTEAGRIAQTLSDQNIRTYSDTTLRRWRDPQAEMIARIYTTLLRQLAEPFQMVVQVASADPSTAWTVARSVGAAITAGRDALVVEAGEQELPTGFDVRAPRDDTEKAAVRRCFSHLTLSHWGNQLATQGKERLVYLVGPKGAAAAFRFPISVQGGVPGIAVRQLAPDFEPGPRPSAADDDELHLGTFRRGGAVTLKLQHLTRHALITGFTGAGKTNTALYVLNQLWADRQIRKLEPIPFLVIEAAKKEYRGLLGQPGFEDLLIFTLGDETTSPFRLNPFELLPGVRLEAHLGKLQTCFDAALPQFGILPSIISESLDLIYQDKGWNLTDRCGDDGHRLFPTMRDMFAKVIQVAESRGYAGETYQNIRAAAAGRIGGLLRGSIGQMFTCQRSVSMDLLMTRPVVLELNDLNPQDKALTMMFLLMLLREYRETHRAKSLQHITMIEEAHNVMENVRSVGPSEIAADTRARAVEAFTAMLAEVRAYGEGIIISDQSPEKLAPDAIRNTNLQISHQLRHRSDREAIAAAMIMDEAQEEYLGKLRVGEAAVFLTGYDRATFMQVPNYKERAFLSEPTDELVASHMEPFNTKHVRHCLPFDGCRYCGQPCVHREKIGPMTLVKEAVAQFRAALMRFDEYPEREYWMEHWDGVARICADISRQAGCPGVMDAAWCYLTHEIDFGFTDHMRVEFEQAYARLETG